MARVVLGDRWARRRPSGTSSRSTRSPTMKRQRHGDQRDRGDRGPVDERLVAVERADSRRRAPTAKPNASGWLIATRYQPGARSLAASVTCPPPATPRRYFTSVSISSGESWSLKVVGHDVPSSKPAHHERAGILDRRLHVLLGRLALGLPFLAAVGGQLVERSGPTVAFEPASASVWQASQPVSVKSCLAGRGGRRPRRRRRRRRRAWRLAREPGAVKAARPHDPHRLAHGRVADAAQLGADHVVLAEPVGRQPDLGGQAGHGVGLEPELRHPEVVQHVLRVDRELDRAVLRAARAGCDFTLPPSG